MSKTSKQRLAEAQRRLSGLGGSDNQTWRAAFDELYAAERAFAADRGDQYATPVHLGPRWDVGAPLPHLISNGSSVFVVCHASTPDPDWDGTYVTEVSSGDTDPAPLLIIEAERCHEVRLGGPNDEAQNGHPLSGKGLEWYHPNEVHNSQWIEHAIRVNSVHPHHSDEPYRELRHFVLPFHDEMVEVLAQSIKIMTVNGTIRDVLIGLVERLTV